MPEDPPAPAGHDPGSSEPATAILSTASREWFGEFRFTPFSVGDPGQAMFAPSYPDPQNWDIRDTVLDGVVLRGERGAADLELRAASTRGRRHRYEGTVRQDAYAFRCDGRHVVAAVADGVSSGVLSHVAANVVTQQGCQLITAALAATSPPDLDWTEILRVMAVKVVNAGRRRLWPGRPVDEHTDVEEIAKQLSTTILFVVVEMEPLHGRHGVHIQAHGDTTAWILRAGTAAWEPQLPVKNAGVDVASSATNALPYYPTAAGPAVRAGLGKDDVLLLISDGIGDPLSGGSGPVGAFLAEQWRRPPEPLAFAAHVDFARRTHDDDRTAVALWPLAKS